MIISRTGAATPVQIGLPSVPTGESGEDKAAADQSSAMERKIINDATAYITSLAELRGRNGEWAVSAVTDAATLPASQALAMNVIDIVAEDVTDLVRQLQGRIVQVHGRDMTLDTTGKILQVDEPDWRSNFLQVITNPNLILILGMLGAYALVIEFYTAGFGFAGITGAICLMLAAYGLQLLPINYAGLGLILFGMILIIAEAFVPSFGILGVGGIISFMIGAIVLVDSEVSVFRVSWPLLAAIAVGAAALVIYTVRTFMKIRHQPLVSGVEMFIGHTGVSVASFDKTGMVKVDGELWKAVTDTPLHEGDKIKVQQVHGLELVVTKI